MVNFGLNSASILGIFLAIAGAALYMLRSVRPELSRDYDIFFSAVGLLCGGILLFYGWLLEPLLQFQHLLLAGSTIFFAVETIRLRGVTATQAKRNVSSRDSYVEEDRPVSRRVVLAELDELEPYEEDRYEKRRLRGTQDYRSGRPDEYEAEARRPRSRGSSATTRPPERPTRPRRTRPSTPPPSPSPSYGYEPSAWDDEGQWEDTPSTYEERPTPSRRPRRPRPPETNLPTEEVPPAPRPRQRRPRPSDEERVPSPERETPPTDYADYVDYQPINKLDDEAETDNAADFDD